MISGNAPSGDWIDGTFNKVYGNTIGMNAAGDTNLGNTNDGITVTNAASDNSFLANRIAGNGGTGIDLANNGVTANDSSDGDARPNELQNFPVITSATSVHAGTTLVGNLNSNANTTYRIDFYSNRNNTADGMGYGEAERWLGFTTVTSDVSGNASYNVTLANAWVNSGDRVTATATVDLGSGNYGSTSEFAQNATATSQGIIVVDTISNLLNGTTTSISALGTSRGADNRISLREAITATNNTANTGGNPDKIVFAIPGPLGTSTVQTITVTGSDLPVITQQIIIDGSTQTGFVSSPLISIVDGDTRATGLSLEGTSSGSTIRGLNIQGFTHGINVITNNNWIAGNWLGTNSAGTAAAANTSGVNIWSGDNNLIGGTTAADRNVISGNSDNGITVTGGADNTQILGNYIGTHATGLQDRGNTFDGVRIQNGATSNYIGGAGNRRNIIAGNDQDGIQIDGEATDGNWIQNNWIGLAANGTTVLGNAGDSIFISGGADNTTIGGGTGNGNVILGSGFAGVEIDGSSTGTVITSNFIGIDSTGTVVAGSMENGILLENGAEGSTGNVITSALL